MQHSVLTRLSGLSVHPDKVCLTVSCVYTHPVQGLASLRTLDYNSIRPCPALFSWPRRNDAIGYVPIALSGGAYSLWRNACFLVARRRLLAAAFNARCCNGALYLLRRRNRLLSHEAGIFLEVC